MLSDPITTVLEEGVIDVKLLNVPPVIVSTLVFAGSFDPLQVRPTLFRVHPSFVALIVRLLVLRIMARFELAELHQTVP